ncbi:MAG: carbohydrate kinase family protein [Desulfurococcales archaeon]|nr:carbohydrate kinase family protein [Desulfurococcales archaeon]
MVLPRPGSQVHLAVGNINIDISLYVPRIPGGDEIVFATDTWVGPGGAATNYSIAVARLGQKSMLRAVAGREAATLGILEAIKSNGVDTSLVSMSPKPAGMVVVMVDAERSLRTMVTVRGANEDLTIEEPHLRGFKGHIHLASVKPQLVSDARRHCRECTISYDPGGEALRRPRDVIEVSREADWVFINTVELKGMTGSPDPLAASVFLERGARLVVVKHGKGGATVLSERRCLRITRLPRVNVVDVTGAGDAFDAAFNVWLLAGAPLEEALRHALAAGSAKVTRRGSSSMPTLEEVLALAGDVGGVEDCV